MRGTSKVKANSRQRTKVGRDVKRRTALALARSVEGLENRTLLTAAPVLMYHFTAPPDAGDVVTNDGAAGATYTGTFQPTGTGGPTRLNRDNTAGDTSNPAAITLNGTTQVIETATPLQSVLGRTSSLTAWFRTTSLGVANAWEAPGITGVEDAGTENDIFWGFMDGTGRIALQVGNDTGNAARSVNTVNDNLWHHVAMTRDMGNGQLRLFVDGVLQGAVRTSQLGEKGNPAGGGLPAGFLFKTIGAIEDEAGVGSRDEWNGGLDEVLVFDRALTDAEINTIYTVGPLGTGLPNGTAPAVTVTSVAGRPAQLNLTWTQTTPDTNESGYEILRSTSAAGPFAVIGQTGPDAAAFSDAGLNPGTQYFYKVRAFNLGGPSTNESAVQSGTTVTMASIAGPGAIGELFNNFGNNNNEPQFRPSFAERRVIRVDPTINLDFGNNAPDPLVQADDHSNRYSGVITVPTTGVYTFVSNTDDAGYLYVKGVLVSQDPGGHGSRNATELVPISLTAGERVPFVFYQADRGGGSLIRMQWIQPGGSLEVVPAGVISTPDTLPSQATNVSAAATQRTIILNWTNNSLNETGVVVDIKKTAEPDSAYRELRFFDRAIENPNSAPVTAATSALNLDPATSYTFRITDFNTQGNAVTTFTTSTATIPAGTLTVNQAAAAGDVNLTKPASIDWRHWGLAGATSTNTKARGANPAGVVVFEAESGGVFTDPDADGTTFNVINEADASDGRALRANDADTDAANGVTSGFVTWTLNFPQTGQYQLFLRRKTDGGGGDNSLWRNNGANLDVDPATFDDTPSPFATQFDNQVGFANQYVWSASDGISPAGQPANAGPVIFTVTTPGNHTFTLGARELGYRIDKIALIPTALVPATDPERQSFLDSLTPTSERAGGPITTFTPIGTPTVVANSAAGNTFTWADGTPTASATATPTGIATSGAGNGFRFTVPASAGASRQLKVYVGVSEGASGDLSFTLSDGSVAPATRTLTDTPGGGPTLAVYTVEFASGNPNQSLQVDWVSTGGEIILKAAEWLETTTPAAPQMTATGTGHGLIALQWNDLGNETSYVLERAPDSNPTAFTTLATLPTGSSGYVDNAGPGNRFHYRLRATNALGSNNSAVVNATAPTIESPGLNATYFNNDNWTGTTVQRFDTGIPGPTQPDTGGRGPIDFFWDTRSPVAGIDADTFSSRWDGYVIPNFTQLYTFFADTDDGARIYVDVNEDGTFQPDERIFIDTTGHGVGTQRSSGDPAYGNGLYLGGVPLIAGHHYRFRFEQTEGGGGAGARAFWQSPNTPNQVIPLTNTRPFQIPDLVPPTVTAVDVDGALPAGATYTSQQHLIVRFSEPVTGVDGDDFNIYTADNQFAAVGSQHITVQYHAASNSAILTFQDLPGGFGSTLPDGNYRIEVLGATISDAQGNLLDGDPATPGAGDNFSQPFYFFQGDTQDNFDGTSNPDRKITFGDYQIMAKNFGKANPTHAEGDFNHDGQINNDDFLFLFGPPSKLGNTLPPPPPAAPPVQSPAIAPVPARPVPKLKPAPVSKPKVAAPVALVTAPPKMFATKRIGAKDLLA